MWDEDILDEDFISEEEKEEDFYSDEYRENELVDNDEITPEEEGFMLGWEKA